MSITFKQKTKLQEAAGSAPPTSPSISPKNALLPGRTPKLMTMKEAAALLRISISTMRRMVKARVLPVYHVGGRWMFELFDLSAYLDRQRVGSLH